MEKIYVISEDLFKVLNAIHNELDLSESLNNPNITRELHRVIASARLYPEESFRQATKNSKFIASVAAAATGGGVYPEPTPGEGSIPGHNILLRADQIVNHRAEEKLRQYGPFGKAMQAIATCFNALTGHELEPKHVNLIYMLAKLQREAHCHKEDNLLDLVAYAAQLNNQEEGVEQEDE